MTSVKSTDFLPKKMTLTYDAPYSVGCKLNSKTRLLVKVKGTLV